MSYYDADPWANHQLNEIKCGECEREYDEQEGEGNICPACKEKEGEKVDLIQCDFCGEYYEHEQEKEGENE